MMTEILHTAQTIEGEVQDPLMSIMGSSWKRMLVSLWSYSMKKTKMIMTTIVGTPTPEWMIVKTIIVAIIPTEMIVIMMTGTETPEGMTVKTTIVDTVTQGEMIATMMKIGIGEDHSRTNSFWSIDSKG